MTRTDRWLNAERMSLFLVLGMCAGCSGDFADAPDEGEDIGVTQQAHRFGTWIAGVTTNPVTFAGGTICAAVDPRDLRAHPGRLSGGRCRYNWDGAAASSATFKTLVQNTPPYELAIPPEPPTALSGPDNDGYYEVCVTNNTNFVPGKVAGLPPTCRYEWTGVGRSTSSFWYVFKRDIIPVP
jgi:hypothetical protein